MKKCEARKSGDNSTEATPVPIPNTEVKFRSADDTWRLPGKVGRCQFFWPYGQAVKTPPFHGGNPGSIPGRVTIYSRVWWNWQTRQI